MNSRLLTLLASPTRGGVPASEYAALVALYEATDGDNWTDNTRWLSNEPVSTWYGVTVTNGRVTDINLNNNKLAGAIPLAWLRRWPRLTYLRAGAHAALAVSGALADLPAGMRYLSLFSTKSLITGALADLPAGMQHLTLSSTQSVITGTLADLPAGMQYLSLHSTQSVITGGGAATSRRLTDVRLEGLGLNQAAVDSILWSLYLAAITPRTETGGTINVGGTNAAPSGAFQAAASCPVTVDTDGKEIAWELLNDGCSVGFNKWATVTITA